MVCSPACVPSAQVLVRSGPLEKPSLAGLGSFTPSCGLGWSPLSPTPSHEVLLYVHVYVVVWGSWHPSPLFVKKILTNHNVYPRDIVVPSNSYKKTAMPNKCLRNQRQLASVTQVQCNKTFPALCTRKDQGYSLFHGFVQPSLVIMFN